jgi:hypothetical protein
MWIDPSEPPPTNYNSFLGSTTVTLNGAVPNIPGGRLAGALGFQHQWISTSTGLSAGMGDARGVPGENRQTSADLPFTPTFTVNHAGRVPQTTQSITGVKEQLTLGFNPDNPRVRGYRSSPIVTRGRVTLLLILLLMTSQWLVCISIQMPAAATCPEMSSSFQTEAFI